MDGAFTSRASSLVEHAPRPSPRHPPAGFDKLRALVLLAGSVRPSLLSRSLDRSIIELPVSPSETVLQQWLRSAEQLAEWSASGAMSLRLVIDRAGREPQLPPNSGVDLRVERDRAEFRGTGGVIRDLAADYGDDDLILVANAAQVLLEPLPDLTATLFAIPGDVRLIAHRDGTPSGLLMVRCGCMRSVGEVGFMDLKEQVLPKLAAAGHVVNVVQRDAATGLPIRTLEAYIEAVRCGHRARAGLPIEHDAFAERWESTFTIAEPGAQVDPTARLQDSVVLKGGVVGRGATVVGSVVTAGGVVYPGATVVDRVITAKGAKDNP